MDWHGILSHPLGVIGIILSACLTAIAGVWKAFSSETVVPGSYFRREVERADRNEALLHQLVGINDRLIGTTTILAQRSGPRQEASDEPA